MDLKYINCVKTGCLSTFFDICQAHIAVGEENTIKLNVSVSDDDSHECSYQEILLTGHHRNITALRFVMLNSEEVSLVTASSDYIIIWHLNEVISSYNYGEIVRGHILYSSSDVPCDISYLEDFQLLGIVFETSMIVLDMSSEKLDKVIASVEIKGISYADFLNESSLVTSSICGEIYRINYDDSIESSSREIIRSFNSDVTSLTSHSSGECFAVGFANAVVYEFVYHSKLQQYQQYMKVDLDERLLHLQESGKSADEGDQSSGNVIELCYTPARHGGEDDRAPLLASSPLNTQTKLSKPNKPRNDKPVTFKSKIKSSGYTAAPRMTMFKPNTSFSHKKPSQAKPSISIASKRDVTTTLPNWFGDKEVCERVVICLGEFNITSIAMNERTNTIACSLNNSSVHVARLPLANFNNKSKVITGHSQPVFSCSWSYDKDILMTCSRNRELKLWRYPYTNEPSLSFHVDSSEKIAKDLIHAQFYYLDKFLLAAVGNSISLIKYALVEERKDDVKRYLNKGKIKVVGKWPLGSAQNLTCFTSPNNFYSYMTLACGSDRSITAFDLNTCKEVLTFTDAHTRPAHIILQSMSPSTSNVEYFLTNASNDGVKLWDLRTKSCARKFQQHQSATKCQVSLSGCGNFIACATDRKSVCLYDIRQTFMLQELNRKTKITSMKFTPDSNKLLLGDDSSALVLLGPS